MKKVVFSILSVLFFVSAVAAQEFDPLQGRTFQLGIRFGFGYAKNNQMNDLMHEIGDYETASMNFFMSTSYPSIPGTFENSKEKADWNLGLDLEPRMFFENFGLGVSIGYHATNTASSNIEHTTFTDNVSYSMKLQCIPILATLYYRIDMSDSLIFLLGAGGGYYFGTIKYKWEDGFSLSATYNESESESYKGNAYGAHARLELNYILNIFTLFAGVEGRYVKFSEFKVGNDTLLNVEGEKLTAQLTGVFFYFGASVLL